MQEVKFIGIDPGQSGGIAVVTDYGITECWKMPDTERDTYELLRSLFLPNRSRVTIEKVGAMPGNGVSGMFKFGRSLGFLRGLVIALEFPFEDVTPQRWQKALGCLTKGDKNVSKRKAQELFPLLKVTHATADALLIAEYARRTHFRELSDGWRTRH